MPKHFLIYILLSLTATLALAQPSPEPHSVRMVKSELQRNPDPKTLDFNTMLKWNYTHGLEIQSMLLCGSKYQTIDPSVMAYATRYCDSIVDAKGQIYKYKTSNYSLDHINAGKMLFLMLDRTGDRRYKTALDSLYTQLQHHPRVSEGGFWHKKAYPWQMWLDGIYMGSPFYAEYAARFLQGAEQEIAFADVVHQFMTIARHTYDPDNGLYRHAWDERHAQPWADPATGQAPHVWGRALGWFTMAMVDVYELLPEGNSGRDSIASLLRPLAKTLLKIQDKETSAWYQVLDAGQREGNYLETSCTAMFAYTFLKGAQLGVLEEKYLAEGKRVLEGLNRYFIRDDGEGMISITRVCAVAGLGGTPYRSGSYDYYIHETIRDNDPKAVGPYIMASLLIND